MSKNARARGHIKTDAEAATIEFARASRVQNSREQNCCRQPTVIRHLTCNSSWSYTRDPNLEKIDCESDFFFRKKLRSEREANASVFSAKRSEFASHSQFFAILRKMLELKKQFLVIKIAQNCAKKALKIRLHCFWSISDLREFQSCNLSELSELSLAQVLRKGPKLSSGFSNCNSAQQSSAFF